MAKSVILYTKEGDVCLFSQSYLPSPPTHGCSPWPAFPSALDDASPLTPPGMLTLLRKDFLCFGHLAETLLTLQDSLQMPPPLRNPFTFQHIAFGTLVSTRLNCSFICPSSQYLRILSRTGAMRSSVHSAQYSIWHKTTSPQMRTY